VKRLSIAHWDCRDDVCLNFEWWGDNFLYAFSRLEPPKNLTKPKIGSVSQQIGHIPEGRWGWADWGHAIVNIDREWAVRCVIITMILTFFPHFAKSPSQCGDKSSRPLRGPLSLLSDQITTINFQKYTYYHLHLSNLFPPIPSSS
jgi:hypothetical protein